MKKKQDQNVIRDDNTISVRNMHILITTTILLLLFQNTKMQNKIYKLTSENLGGMLKLLMH